MHTNSNCWVLIDHRTGNNNQAIALARALGVEYTLKHITYNFLGWLPNLLLQYYPIHVCRNRLRDMELLPPPKIIISAGRRSAALAAYFKKHYGNALRTIQIMRPGISQEMFDLIILPQHDDFACDNFKKVVRVVGALSKIDDKITEGAAMMQADHPELLDFIAVMIGGDTKDYKFTISHAAQLVEILQNLSHNHEMKLFISFSRRTPEVVKNMIRQHFGDANVIYDPKDGGINPYFGMLAQARYIITTADSISMCSEVASTGKPFYIFCPEEFQSKKHRFFLRQLLDLKVARKLELTTHLMEQYTYTPLNELKRVAEIIKTQIL